MDVGPGRDEALSRLFEAHYPDTVRLAFYLTGSWTAGEAGRPVPLPGIAPTALAVGEGAVWVGELDGKTLTRFDLTR
jgi:hypothetical protein